jgi:hypothetical protein
MIWLLSGACALIVMSMAVTIWWTWPTEEDHLTHSLIELAEFTAGHRYLPGDGSNLGGVVNDDPASFICGGAGEPAASGADSLRGRVRLRLVK